MDAIMVVWWHPATKICALRITCPLRAIEGKWAVCVMVLAGWGG